MIRRILTILLSVAAISNLQAQPKAEFEKTTIDFGTVLEGTICKYSFKFKNTGNAPMTISNVSVTCGCTVPRWSQTPIAEGDTSSVYIEFDTKFKRGQVAKGVNLTTNCAEPMIGLIILANIIPDSNFRVVTDSISHFPLKTIDQNGYFQVMLPVKNLKPKVFKGNGFDLEAMAKRIITAKEPSLNGNLWYTTTDEVMIINMYQVAQKQVLVKLLKSELGNKRRLKYWQKQRS